MCIKCPLFKCASIGPPNVNARTAPDVEQLVRSRVEKQVTYQCYVAGY